MGGTSPIAVRLESATADRMRPWIIGGATTCFVLALVAAGLIMTTTGAPTASSSDPGIHITTLAASPTTEAGSRSGLGASGMQALVSTIGPSTVALIMKGQHGTWSSLGLVVESGGIIVTPAQTLAGARTITVVEEDGTRRTGTVVGSDPGSGLEVIRIPDDLPAATFDDTDPADGTQAVALSLEEGSRVGAPPTPHLYAGTVVSSGQALPSDQKGGTFATTTVAAPLSSGDVGCPLLDGSGSVEGLLTSGEWSGHNELSVFLPAALVEDVAEQLITSGQVVHGWMGIAAGNLPAGAGEAGAEVDAVSSGGPAADGGIDADDVITGIDGSRVLSAADFDTRLYAEPPGTAVTVALDRDGIPITVSVVLAASPDASQPSPSP